MDSFVFWLCKEADVSRFQANDQTKGRNTRWVVVRGSHPTRFKFRVV